MSFLTRIFGAEKPTSVRVAAALADAEAELRDVPARIARARATLELVADMTDEQHAEADDELAAAMRSEARLTAQIKQLVAVREQAEKSEAAAALSARANAAQRRVDEEGPKLLADYEKHAARLAKVAAALREIAVEVDGTNYTIGAASRDDPALKRPSRVVGIGERFLTEPDAVEPDRVVEEEQWGYLDENGRWRLIGVFGERNGGRFTSIAGAQKRTKRTIIPGQTRPGRKGFSPHEGLRLPTARLGADAFWPRKQ
ncbi:hypothetical protein GOFOIKOB_4874 [Methylobacterium tardum]|uniref:Uncharacterized protein n=1 Tax=Methylobacterium tardum TaxID=374432 RepID=A0AA37TM28_9HYPH|nr:hypothetical protein [Methylobacterium tardum]URD35807.1 hypothetical protein M6G65_25675 [Methylobacterium tardum]GJE51810.1 hypothetical protein GOFOIKOB_4874 [Methylobacterium tardum]GLS72332.1 hypothetical protein GCM10007890_43450 [Methylobacterium tardum]